MPYIPPDELAAAKQMDLLTYLQNYESHELVRLSSNVYSTREHGSLKISNGKWMWHSRGIGGRSALDFLIKVRGMSLTDAAAQILGRTAIQPLVYRPVQVQESAQFILPKPHTDNEDVTSYLRLRGINNSIIQDCIGAGLLYESHNYVAKHDRTFANAVFVGCSPEGEPRYAALRGTGGNFKGEAPGSDKRYSFSLSGGAIMKKLHLFECAVDLLSYSTLLRRDGKDYTCFNMLSLAGVYLPKEKIEESTRPAALVQYLQDNPHIREIALHLDNDEPGRLASKAITALMGSEYHMTDAPPPRGKDVNDYLRFRLGIQERSMPRLR